MGQVLHRSATTTEAIRRAIQHGQESLRRLSRRQGINLKTMGYGNDSRQNGPFGLRGVQFRKLRDAAAGS